MEGIERLLDCARQGNAEALSALYRRFLPGIFGYIAARVPDRVTAEDLTSDVFLQMVEGIGHLRAEDEAGFTAWLLRIARVRVAGYYRQREKQPAHLSLPGEGWENTYAESLMLMEDNPEANPVQWTEAREDWQPVVEFQTIHARWEPIIHNQYVRLDPLRELDSLGSVRDEGVAITGEG